MQKEWQNIPALLLIDIQKGLDDLEFYGGERNNPDAEHNASMILGYWRKNGWPLFHVQHCSITPGSPLTEGLPGNEIKDEVKPLAGEPVIRKNVNSAFIGTDLKERLDSQGIQTVVIVGYNTVVIPDATAAFRSRGLNGEAITAQLVHDVSLATLNDEFAEMLSTRDILASRFNHH
jgi:nicotinamidase-related amidase